MDTDSGGSSSNTPSRGPGLESPRVSQRASNSCAFCTKRKIKCNKAIPCDNCIRRGHPESCTRLPAIVRGRLINAPSAAQRAPLTPDQIRLLREGQLQRENVGLRRRVGDLESRIRELEAGGSGSTPSARPGSRARDSGPASGPTPSSSADSPLDGGNAFAHLLSAANGHAASGHTAHREGPEKSRQDDPDVLEPFVHVMGIPKQPERAGSPHPGRGSTSGNGGLPDLPSRKSTDLGQTDLLTLLPTPPQSSLIIRASFKYLCFFHPSVHVPTFIKEHDEWIAATAEGENLEKGDAWLSYYFGLLSVGMYMCGDLLAPELNLTGDETLSLASFWFDVTLEALNRSKFMSTNPTMEALMTICILPIVSYHFGASAYCEMLLHVGLRIAQMLRLHLLTPEPEDKTDLTPGLIYREQGRRIWLHLRLGEGRPDFANIGGLRLPQGATAEPLNVDDEDITDTTAKPRPLSEFTRITHLLCAGRRYRIFRQFAEAFAEATSLKDQYVIAMAADQALQANFATFPALNGTDGDTFDEQFDLNGPHDFRPHSRYIWSLLQASGTVLVYRSFLGRAYVDERFSEVRDTCLAAAREILRQRRRHVPPMFLRAWPVASYTVLAGVVLGTELVHGSPTDAERAQLVADVQFAIDSLWLCGSSSLVVQRGVLLLRRFVEAPAKPPASVPENIAAAVGGVAPAIVAGAPLPAAQELWPTMQLEHPPSGPGDVWVGEDVWSSALVALENEESSGWWTTLL
ncbi:uncharacterized protein LOC62_07G009566 [Vanrija pseudolonga]|uniref:Zn(2)-C6 fungal-type domain-containing protein n=1 Tax=Vanrija pseudolonga TaxID=143232 RepID=A0AAF0YGP9_9TREE|nr:hypothetical protein LOC62_07G009566 [Vanrija pseudolonga]